MPIPRNAETRYISYEFESATPRNPALLQNAIVAIVVILFPTGLHFCTTEPSNVYSLRSCRSCKRSLSSCFHHPSTLFDSSVVTSFVAFVAKFSASFPNQSFTILGITFEETTFANHTGAPRLNAPVTIECIAVSNIVPSNSPSKAELPATTPVTDFGITSACIRRT